MRFYRKLLQILEREMSILHVHLWCDRPYGDKLAFAEEEIKKIKVMAKVMRAQLVENVAKLESALAEIEALKKEVHESHTRLLP